MHQPRQIVSNFWLHDHEQYIFSSASFVAESVYRIGLLFFRAHGLDNEPRKMSCLSFYSYTLSKKKSTSGILKICLNSFNSALAQLQFSVSFVSVPTLVGTFLERSSYFEACYEQVLTRILVTV